MLNPGPRGVSSQFQLKPSFLLITRFQNLIVLSICTCFAAAWSSFLPADPCLYSRDRPHPPWRAVTQSLRVQYLMPPTPSVFSAHRFSSMDSHGRLTLLPSHFSCSNKYSGYGEAIEHFLDHRHKLFSLTKNSQTSAATADPATLCRLKCDSHLSTKSEQKFSFKDFLPAKAWEANITSQIPSLR